MSNSDKFEKVFLSKIIFTLMILSLYKILRCIPLYGVDIIAYESLKADSDIFIQQTVGGDYYRNSIMALGISPYMISTMLVMLIGLFGSKEKKARTSPIGMNRMALLCTIILSITMGINQAEKLMFYSADKALMWMKPIAVLEMVTGVLIIVWMAGRNKKYGLGGQSAIFLVNILDNVLKVVQNNEKEVLILPLGIGGALMLVMLFLENCEKRIPLQRISIHNIYADKNYQAIKFNPIGVIPMVFASAFFMLPQLIVSTLAKNFPNNANIIRISGDMVINKPLGMAVYIGGLFFLNIGLSFLMLQPKDLAERFLKSGDSFVGIHPGKYTRRYLRKHLFLISLISSIVLSCCLLISFYMIVEGGVAEEIAMLPTSLMMMTGLFCVLYQEATAVFNTDRYKTFI